MRLRGSQIKALSSEFGLELTKKSVVEFVDGVTFIDGVPSFFLVNEKTTPTLHVLRSHPLLLPQVMVDQGALPFLLKGADVMRPGIVNAQSQSLGERVVVVDNERKQPIAVGVVLMNDFLSSSSGKALKTVHYVGDALWKLSN